MCDLQANQEYDLLFVPGLAYAVPVSHNYKKQYCSDHPQMRATNDLDSAQVVQMIQDYQETGVAPPGWIGDFFDDVGDVISDVGDGVQDIFDDIGDVFRKRYHGDVKGRLTTIIKNDLGDEVEIGLAGVQVILKDKEDTFLDETFATTYTDKDGYYSLHYDEWQSGLENHQVDLYLLIKSKSRRFSVDKGSAFDGVYKQIVNLGGKSSGYQYTGRNVPSTHNAFKVVHWMNRAWSFVEESGVNLNSGLKVLINQPSTSFFNGYRDLLPLSNPLISLDNFAGTHENTIYHEFGHFLQWILQGKKSESFIIQTRAGGHSGDEQNTSRLAFSEGWASGFAYMVDAYYWRDDNEYGDGSKQGREYKPYAELRTVTGYQQNKGGKINNGIGSEYFVATALYDLWDGKDKGLPESLGDIDVEYKDSSGYQDNYPNGTKDNVSLSFQTLIKPFSEGVISDPYEYCASLFNYIDSDKCGLRADIMNVFNENRVVFDITAYDDGYNTAFSNDGLFTEKTVNYVGYLGPIQAGYYDHYKLNYKGNHSLTKSFNENEIVLTDWINIDASSKPKLWLKGQRGGSVRMCHKAMKIIVGKGELVLGTGTSPLSLIVGAEAKLVISSSDGTISLHNDAEIIVEDKGLLKIEDNVAFTLAKGTIRVKSGGTLWLVDDTEGSTLSLINSGKLIVEDGANVCVGSFSKVNYQNGSQIVVGSYTKGLHSYWGVSTSCKDIVKQARYNVSLRQTANLDCSTGAFNFSISDPSLLPADAKICWTCPDDWNVNGGQNCERWTTSISGSVNNWGNGAYKTGIVTATITSSQGIEYLRDTVYEPVYPVLTTKTNENLTICQNNPKSITVNGADATEDYTFNWQGRWGLNHTLNEGNTYSQLRFTTPQWSTEQQNVSVNATDSRGCESNTLSFTVNPNDDGWEASPIWTNRQIQVKSLSLTNKKANIVSDRKGNIFYVGSDHNLYSYTYNSTLGHWENKQLLDIGNCAGNIAIYLNPIRRGDRKISYVTFAGEIKTIRSTSFVSGWTKLSSPNVIVNDPDNTLLTYMEGGTLVYSDQDQLYDAQGNLYQGMSSGVDSPILLSYKSEVIFRQNDGGLGVYHIVNKTLRNIPVINLKSTSTLGVDNDGIVWFVNQGGEMQNYSMSNFTTSTVSGTYNPLGQFSVNKETGVVYHYQNYEAMNQLYYDGEFDDWKSRKIARVKLGGVIHFHNPNVFYVQQNGYVWDVFYYLQGCTSALYRGGGISDNLEQMISQVAFEHRKKSELSSVISLSKELIIYPNPSNGNVNISADRLEGRLIVTTLEGKVVHKTSVFDDIEEVELNLILPKGMYVLEQHVGDEIVTRAKLIIE